MFSIHETEPLETLDTTSETVNHPYSPSGLSSPRSSTLFSRFSGTMRRSRSTPVAPIVATGRLLDSPVFDMPPRSTSVMSWFSDDSSEEEDGKRQWKFTATLRRKRSRLPSTPTIASPRSLPLPPNLSPTPPRTPSIDSFCLPETRPLDLDLDLDFDCQLPNPSDEAPTHRLSFANFSRSLDFEPKPKARRHTSWSPSMSDSAPRKMAYSRWSSDDRSTAAVDWADAFSLNSPRTPRSPDMMECDEECVSPSSDKPSTPKAARVDYDEDRELFAFFAGDVPSFPSSFQFGSPPAPRVREHSSADSLMDPDLLALPPSTAGSLSTFGLDFPLPPSLSTKNATRALPYAPSYIPSYSPSIASLPTDYGDVFFDCD
ncbi:hypothetical protein JCM10213_007079 [Rhodosporidiobolus nylandii]